MDLSTLPLLPSGGCELLTLAPSDGHPRRVRGTAHNITDPASGGRVPSRASRLEIQVTERDQKGGSIADQYEKGVYQPFNSYTLLPNRIVRR